MKWSEILEQYEVVEKPVQITDRIEFKLSCIRDINALVDAMGPDDFGPDERLPYWASLWPVAVDLGRFLLENENMLQGPVLELGAGLGLVSLTIAHMGQDILATDYEPEAIAFIKHNAQANGLSLRTQQWDWREESQMQQSFRTIVGADLLYEARNVDSVSQAIDHVLQPGGIALIADPKRPHWPHFRDRLGSLGLSVESVEQGQSVLLMASKPLDLVKT